MRRIAAVIALAAALSPCQLTLAQDVVPPRFSPEDIAAGHAQYNKTCVHCHGFAMVNSGTTVYDLRRFPLDDTARFYNSVSRGKGNMPSFQDSLTPEQIWLLWAYVGSRGGKEP